MTHPHEHGHSFGTPIELADGSHVDAFGRLRVSNPTTIFDSKLLAGTDQPLLWDEALESGGGITATTPTADKPYIDLVSTAGTAGVFTRQTRQRFNYQPGKSQMIMMTGILNLSGGGAGVSNSIGLFDDSNGAFFKYDEGVVKLVLRSSDSGTPVDTEIHQGDWNVDTLSGGGAHDREHNPSGNAVDWTMAQIFVIDFQWLSIGRVRFGVFSGDKIIHVHEQLHADRVTIPWTSTPNLPLRHQIITTSSSQASSQRCICSAVISEGGADPIGIPFNFRTTTVVNANTIGTKYALAGIRLASAHLGCDIEPLSIDVLAASTNEQFEWQFILNPTVAGVFTYAANLTNSCTEQALSAGGNPSAETVTGGHIVAGGYGATNQRVSVDLQSSLRLGAAIDGTKDTFVLAIIPFTSNVDMRGIINWREHN